MMNTLGPANFTVIERLSSLRAKIVLLSSHSYMLHTSLVRPHVDYASIVLKDIRALEAV